MAEIEFSGNRKTKPTGFSLTPNILKKLDEYANSGEYGSKSSIASQALSEFFARIEMREERDIQRAPDVKEAIADYLQTKEGKALIRSVIMEAFTPTDAAHMKESKKNGNRPIIVDDIIE